MSNTCIVTIEKQWKTKTTNANSLFNKNCFAKAIAEYNQALYKAEVLNMHSADCKRVNIPYMQIFIISCNNLANSYEALGKLEEADIMLRRSVYYLLSLINQKDNELSIIQPELKRATLTYSQFVDKHDRENSKKKQVFEHLKEEFLKEECRVLN